MQLYLHDLSSFTNETPDASGVFPLDEYFDCYWLDSDRFPYILLMDEKPAGFALVRQLAENSYSIAEFFVLRAFRRQGVATKFAHGIFRRHHGHWSVAELEENEPSHAFWRHAISLYTRDQYQEKWSNSQPRGPLQTFDSPTGL